jgi:hypothetical protein
MKIKMHIKNRTKHKCKIHNFLKERVNHSLKSEAKPFTILPRDLPGAENIEVNSLPTLCKIPEIQEELSFCAVSIVFLICWISAFISSDFLLYPPSSKSF